MNEYPFENIVKNSMWILFSFFPKYNRFKCLNEKLSKATSEKTKWLSCCYYSSQSLTDEEGIKGSSQRI